jgi:uncharacterized protein YndB with AHSA1/START domain
MLTIRSSVTVDKPASTVFDYMVEPSNQLHWSPNFLSLDREEPGPNDLGKRFTGTIKKFGTLNLEYSEFERPRRFTMATDHKMGHFTHTFTFEPLGNATVVRQEIGFAPRGSAKLIAPFLKPGLQKMAVGVDREIERATRAL